MMFRDESDVRSKTGGMHMARPQKQHDQRGQPNGSHNTLYTLFLPMNHNNGHPMQPERLHWAQQAIVRFAGGLTCFEPSLGFWVSPALTTVRDFVLPVQSIVASGPEAERYFLRLAAEMAHVLEQQQIFVFTQPVQLLEPTP
jgi:hypothetical protein